MAREELARFAVGRIGIARAHSMNRREVAALFAQDPVSRRGLGVFPALHARLFLFRRRRSRFRRALEAAAAPGAVSFHAFRPAGRGHVAAGYLNELGEHGAPPAAKLDARIDVLLAGDIAEAGQALARLGLDKAHVVLLFPGSGSAEKNWPAEKFAALAMRATAPAAGAGRAGSPERANRIRPDAASGGTRNCMARRSAAGLDSWSGASRGRLRGQRFRRSHLAAASGAPGVCNLRADGS